MPSLTEVANLALAMVGAERVVSLSTDESKPSRLCNEFLPQVRDGCLVSHPWNFAIRRASLPASPTAPAFDFTQAYQVPSDCLRVLRIDSTDPHEPFAREGGRILCNVAAPLKILYIARITEAGAWPALFADLVSARLAERLAVPLSADKAARNAIAELAERAMARARGIDAAEGTPWPQYAPADVFVQARL